MMAFGKRRRRREVDQRMTAWRKIPTLAKGSPAHHSFRVSLQLRWVTGYAWLSLPPRPYLCPSLVYPIKHYQHSSLSLSQFHNLDFLVFAHKQCCQCWLPNPNVAAFQGVVFLHSSITHANNNIMIQPSSPLKVEFMNYRSHRHGFGCIENFL